MIKQIICTFGMSHEAGFFLTQYIFSLQHFFFYHDCQLLRKTSAAPVMEFFLNHSRNYLCWSSALINSVSTISIPRESPVSRVNFSLLDNIYIFQLANYLYLSTLVHLNHGTGGSLPILWGVRFLLNVHFIIPLKGKISGRGLIK